MSKLRVLVLHNEYKERGGEDSVVEAETDLLRRHGHEVEIYRRHNNELREGSRAAAALNTLWSVRSSSDIAAAISRFKPDVVHAHNTFPLISPSVYWRANALQVPVVQTLHNFRLLCPQGQLLRDGLVCEDCVGHIPWRAVRYSCYRKSRAQSAVSAATITLHRAIGSYEHRVSLYIALNEFCRAKFVEGGLPAERIRVKPNFVAAPAVAEGFDCRRAGGLFVGRLSMDKGLGVLLDAAAAYPELEMSLVGAGEYEPAVRERFGSGYLGFRPLPEILGVMARAQYLVVPSIWYENFPRTIVEAYACGLPVIASRLGALPEIVAEGHTGLLFEPGSPLDLANKLRWADQNPGEMARMGQNARRRYETSYSPAKNYGLLVAIYESAIEQFRPAVGTLPT